MAALGRNIKLTVDTDLRTDLRAVFEQVFGCERAEPVSELDVFRFGDGSQVGIYYVAGAEVLTSDELLKSAWIELLADDCEGAAARLDAMGLSRVAYHDQEHRYYRLPGGQVFRLAKT